MTASFDRHQIGIVGVGNYGGALLEGILAVAPRYADSVVRHVVTYDIDRTKTQRFVDIDPNFLSVAHNLNEALASSSVVIVGVNSSQLGCLLEEIDSHRSSNPNMTTEFVFMDNSPLFAQLEAKNRLLFGRVMFTPWVRYCQGIVGFWQGSLQQSSVQLMRALLVPLGDFWLAESPEFLPLIRATAGCGIGMLGTVISTMKKSFVRMGLSDDQAQTAIVSLIQGLESHLSKGGRIEDLAQKVCSSENSLTKVLLENEHTRTLVGELRLAFDSLHTTILQKQ